MKKLALMLLALVVTASSLAQGPQHIQPRNIKGETGCENDMLVFDGSNNAVCRLEVWADGGAFNYPSTVGDNVIVGADTEGGAAHRFNADGSATLNEQGAAVPIIFETPAWPNAFRVNGATNQIGFFGTPSGGGKIHVNPSSMPFAANAALFNVGGSLTVSGSSKLFVASSVFEPTSTLTRLEGGVFAPSLGVDSGTARDLSFFVGLEVVPDVHNTAYDATLSNVYGLQISDVTGAGAATVTAQYGIIVEDQTKGASSTGIRIAAQSVGSALVSAGGDFQVASDGSTHALFVKTSSDRVGVRDSTPDATFNIDGQTDEPLFMVTAHSTQTSELAIFEDNSGADLVVVEGGGDLKIASDTIVNVAGMEYLPRSTGTPAFVSADDASVQAGTASTLVLYYRVPIPAQLHGELVTIEAITFYYALAGTGQVDFNKWGTHVVSTGVSAYFDNDTTPLTAGTSHSVSALPKDLAAGEVLWARISISGGASGTATLYGFAVTLDTD